MQIATWFSPSWSTSPTAVQVDPALLRSKFASSMRRIRPARLKDGSCTDAVKYWAQHQQIDPFIQAYVAYNQ